MRRRLSILFSVLAVAGGFCLAPLEGGRDSQIPRPVRAASSGALPPGLIGWWPGERHPRDAGNLHHGRLVGRVRFVPGPVGDAFSLEGGTSYVAVRDAPRLNVGKGDFSAMAWIRTDQKADQPVIDKRVDARPDDIRGFVLGLQRGFVLVQLADGRGEFGHTNYRASVFVADGRFHHIAATVDRDSRTGGKTYVDGQVIDVFDPTFHAGDLTNPGELRLGRIATPNREGLDLYFRGEIDEPMLFNRALTACEVQTLFGKGAGAQGRVLLPSTPLPAS